LKRLVVAFMFLALAVLTPVWAADVLNPDGSIPEKVLGKADAPLTIVEYASLTCPHCALFHSQTMPELKKTYIESGKVRFIFRDFPLDSLAMAAAMLAHCAGGERYFGFLDVLFRSQTTWSRSKNPRQELGRLARFANVSPEQFDACLNNRALLKAIQDRARVGEKSHAIRSTPTILVGERKVEGTMPFTELKVIIDAALQK
jgi:protein-disulfide isomerase